MSRTSLSVDSSVDSVGKKPCQENQSCFNCALRRFGWKDDTSWDSCDEVCQIGDVGTLLFCVHGMTPNQISAKVRRHSCEKWSKIE